MPPALLHACTATPTVLVDIPSTLSAPPGLVPRSTHKPLAAPHALAEPKQQTPFTQALSALHARLLPVLTAALADLHASYAGAYHSPRSTATATTAAPPPPAHSELDFHACTSLLQPPGGTAATITLTAPTTLSDISDIHATAVTNASDTWLTLTLAHPSPPKLFHLPPRASFLLSRFQPAAAAAAFTAFAAAAGRRRFDFALLDPPWPNRSAARSAAYATLSSSSRPGGGGIHELLQLPLGPALAPGALVAVWITNKPRHRAFVVERLFARWGVVEAGEWVWLKVTGGGEPVVALEAAMRKPYEVLVFGRKPAGGGERGRAGKRVKLAGAEAGEEEAGVGRVPPMTIVAVPDLHSRKPGVKELVEPYLPEDYRACEIFGRNLTEGWFTWGDEAIKFNWDGHWKPEAAEGSPTTTTTTSSSSSSSSSRTATAAENGDGGDDGDEMTDE